MPEEAEKLGFLSRWSRRKRGDEVPEPEATPAPGVEAAPEAPPPQAEAPPTAPPEPEFDLASLPPIETLDAGSDFSVFLKPGVPQALRTAALRKAWTADPLIRDYMSSLDYAWDFNTPGGLPYGFSNVLAETGEALRKLVNQAIGQMEPEEEKPAPTALVEAPMLEPGPSLAEAALPRMEASDPALEEDVPPETAIRLSEAPAPAIAAAREEPPPPPRRRHGGALPT